MQRNVGGNTTYTRALADGLTAEGVSVRPIKWGKRPSLTAVYETCASLDKVPDTVLHFTADTGPIIRTRTPSVVTVHGIASRWVDGVRSRTSEAIWRTRVSRAVASADEVITVSKSSARDVSAIFNVDASSLHVIPHGIDHARFAQRTEISQSIRDLVPSEYVLYIGNLEPRKNIESLCDAFETQTVKDLGIPLVVAGRPAWGYETFMDRVTNTAGVVYLGGVSDSDVVALLQRAALFVFPSKYEGFGFPVLEAMAAGCPVLTTRRGALDEIAGPAACIEEIDGEAISDGIARCLGSNDWLRQTRRDGLTWVQQFNWADSVEQHMSVYRNAIR